MITSRLRESSYLFDCFFELESNNLDDAKIVYKYPPSFTNEEIIKSIPNFCFPCKIDCNTVSHFSFVLTSEDSKWTYGFVRHVPHPEKNCFVLLSSYPWHDTFYKLLNYIAFLKKKHGITQIETFLNVVYQTNYSASTIDQKFFFTINNENYSYKIKFMNTRNLPCIPDDRNLTEFYNAIISINMISLFASLLNERRIVMHSKKLTKLSSCVQAANLLIYPMQWQHIFIPILPIHLLDYLNAPMPFIIGVPSSTFSKIQLTEFGDIVVLDVDNNTIVSPYDDVNILPIDIVNFLKKGLKKPQNLFGDGLSRLFLRAVVILIGGYREALRFTPGKKITFDENAFIKSRPITMQPFLEKILNLQTFRQFVENRLEKLNTGEGREDYFDYELNSYEYKATNKFKDQYHEWLLNFKKESGSFVKSLNPTVKLAYENIKNKSKKTYKDIRVKLNYNLNKKPSFENSFVSSNLDLNTNLINNSPNFNTKYVQQYFI